MYCVSRYDVLTTIEFMVSKICDKKELTYFSFSLYKNVLEMVVESLNDDYTLSLPDRVDHTLKMRDIPSNISMELFEITLDIAEKARVASLKLGAPSHAKYKLLYGENKHLNYVDQIVIDFESTAYSILSNPQQDDDLDLLAVSDPPLEILNKAYERVEKQNYKKNKY